MHSHDIRKRFLEFFEARGHKIIPSSSLIPENDPTTLFTGSGMQPLLPYLLGKPHPLGRRLADSQKCFRAEDINEVGDNRHTTFFEMLGNWSLGDYFKKEQLRWFFEFLTKEVGLEPGKLYVTVFSGDEKNGIPRDDDSVKIWKELFEEKGIKAESVELLTVERAAELGMQNARIFYYDSKKNWWSRSGSPEKMPAREPGGPDSEVFYEFERVRHDPKFGKNCHPNCDCGRFLEIGNSVFMEYLKKEDSSFGKLSQQNVDFGGGLERIVAASNDDPDIFHIDVFKKTSEALERLGIKVSAIKDIRRFRIVLDHFRAVIFLTSDGAIPSNKDQGYVLRRLMRRSMVYAYLLGLPEWWPTPIVDSVISSYKDFYPEISGRKVDIISVINEEYLRFNRTMSRGLGRFNKLRKIGAEEVFDLHQTYGFPFELTKELISERGGKIDDEEFKKVFEKHQEISRRGAEKKFGGHGLILGTEELKARTPEEAEKVTRLHTATHLLQKALRDVLGPEVRQMGSDITPERTRFDFTFSRKLSREEIKKIEELVNQKIKEDWPVNFVEMPKEKAEKTGALYFFKEKYPDIVKVYFIGENLENAFSKEFCGGPHVTHTAEIGEFKILKEEAVGAGVRRIRAVLD